MYQWQKVAKDGEFLDLLPLSLNLTFLHPANEYREGAFNSSIPVQWQSRAAQDKLTDDGSCTLLR